MRPLSARRLRQPCVYLWRFVRAAGGAGVGLVGATTERVRFVVVDLAAIRGHLTTGVLTEPLQQGGGKAGVAGEQPPPLPEIDHGRVGVEHNSPDLSRQ